MSAQDGEPQQPLSVPFTDWLRGVDADAVLDVAVIGSGYGGSVAALRMRKMGRDVVVLERGSEYLPGEFPNDIGQLPKYQRLQTAGRVLGRATGLFEWRAGPGVATLTGNGLGGGSLINAGVAMRPVPEVFMQSHWPASIRLGSASEKVTGLDAAFRRAERMLRAQAPAALPAFPKTQALTRFAHELAVNRRTREDRPHIDPVAATIDPKRCTNCGDCATGCNVIGAKLTLRDTYLRAAQRSGAVLVCGALVWRIEPRPNGGWWLHCMATEKCGYRPTVAESIEEHGVMLRARHVVIAAGTFGSTELLQRSRHRAGERFSLSVGMLGTRLSANADSISASADEPRPVGAVGWGCVPRPNEPVGPTITATVDLRGRVDLAEQVVIQDGAVPGALARVFQEILATTWTLHHMGRKWVSPRHVPAGTDPLAATPALAAHAQLLLAMGHDGSAGRIVWMPEMDACVPYWVNPEAAAGYRRQDEIFEVLKAIGGTALPSPLWRGLPNETAGVLGDQPLPRTAMSVHPLGGCPMGDSFDTGVVDEFGHVWKAPGAVWPDLQVLDGSIVPTSLGCNPLWTITALAERAMARLRATSGAPSPAAHHGVHPVAPLPPRRPQALTRQTPHPLEVSLRERLVCGELQLRGSLAQAWGSCPVEADLELKMTTPDWLRTWEEASHRFDLVAGTLRVRTKSGQQIRYAILPGSRIELMSTASALLGPGLLRVFVTWCVLRGLRDLWRLWRRNGLLRLVGTSMGGGVAMLRMWLAARELRTMRYDLRLKRKDTAGDMAGPDHLRVFVAKDVRYAATCGEWWRHVGRRISGLFRRHTGGSDGPAPRSLRASYAAQLTSPRVTLAPEDDHPPRRRWLPPRLTRARFDLALPMAIQDSPIVLRGARDSSAAMLELMAYPLLLLRHALKTRPLDFRLPDYSGRPYADPVDGDELNLRAAAASQASDVRPTLTWIEVPRGESSSADGRDPTTPVRLPIWRYARPPGAPQSEERFRDGQWHGHGVRRVKSVLLMHALAMSGSIFTLRTVRCNLAEYLYGKGYEVWIADTRMSPRVQDASCPSTLDQVGLIDAPALVDHVLAVLAREPCGQTKLPLQIFSFAHCMGAGAMLVALLAGRLSHGAKQGDMHMPKLCALVTSQVHPFMVATPSSLAKTWVAPLLRNVVRRYAVPLTLRAKPTSPVDLMMDRLFAALPVPDDEACPGEGRLSRHHDDDCATCRRIRFLDGELFKHRHLNPDTHAALPRLFGDSNVGMLAHGSRILDYERLVDEDGLNAYATDTAMLERLGLAMRFAHGTDNQLFDAEGARRSSTQFARMQPRFAAQFGGPALNGVPDSSCLVDGYGHLDLVIGNDLDRGGAASVFARLTALFDAVWAQANGDLPAASASKATPRLQVRFPYAGPWMGPAFDSNGRRLLPVAFIVEDMRVDAEVPAAPLLACARLHGGPAVETVWLTMHRVKATPAFGIRRAAHLEPAVAVRVAFGRVDITDRQEPLRIELLSCSHTIVDGLTLGRRPDEAEIDDAIARAAEKAAADRASHDRPIPPTVSRLQRFATRPSYRWLKVSAQTVTPPDPKEPVRIALGCCRYPGFYFDRARTTAAFERLALRKAGSAPHLALMLGDQIYADATAGLFDPASPIERYMRAHRKAFRTSRIHRLLAGLPVVMTADDHEFGDNHPNGAPLYRGHASTAAYAADRECALRRAAYDALNAFQAMTWPPDAHRSRCVPFEFGAVRGLVIDTRSFRRAATATRPARILAGHQRRAIEKWLQKSHPDSLNLVCTGSVVLPGVLPASDPANPGVPDNWQGAPEDMTWLLDRLTSMVGKRFVLVSGDCHLSGGAALHFHGAPVGASIVAPPFYAPLPYANEVPASIDQRPFMLNGRPLSLRAMSGLDRGSGFGMLTLTPLAGGAGWKVQYERELLDMEQNDGWTAIRDEWTL